jgi:S1-C subfamily serine protease
MNYRALSACLLLAIPLLGGCQNKAANGGKSSTTKRAVTIRNEGTWVSKADSDNGRNGSARIAVTKAEAIMEAARPSLMVVQFTYEAEMGRRDFSGMGVVVREDGLTMFSIDLSPRILPDEQMKDFKLIVPGDEEIEMDAIFMGRDERYGVSFIKPKDEKKLKAIQFVDRPSSIGETVHSVGLLPKPAGYQPYFTTARVSSKMRGPIPQVLVDGAGLSVIGAPVFNDKGEAIGFINSQPDRSVILNDERQPYGSIENPARLYVPASDFLPAIQNPPQPDKPIKLPFLGVTQLEGLSKDIAEFYGLKGQVAIGVGDVIPGFSAEKAGLKKGQIIVSLNGKPLERGDMPEEAPMILTRQLGRMEVGQKVKLGVITEPNKPATTIEMTLDERPASAGKAKRFYAEDLGFTTRDGVFDDTYARKLPPDSKGIVVTFVRPQSTARAAELAPNDFVTQLNQTPVTSVEQFKEAYQAFRKEKPKEAVVLEVLRGGKTQIIRIEPPRD